MKLNQTTTNNNNDNNNDNNLNVQQQILDFPLIIDKFLFFIEFPENTTKVDYFDHLGIYQRLSLKTCLEFYKKLNPYKFKNSILKYLKDNNNYHSFQICYKHKCRISGYCKNCLCNICKYCQEKHKFHNIEILSKFILSQREIRKMKKKIEKLKNEYEKYEKSNINNTFFINYKYKKFLYQKSKFKLLRKMFYSYLYKKATKQLNFETIINGRKIFDYNLEFNKENDLQLISNNNNENLIFDHEKNSLISNLRGLFQIKKKYLNPKYFSEKKISSQKLSIKCEILDFFLIENKIILIIDKKNDENNINQILLLDCNNENKINLLNKKNLILKYKTGLLLKNNHLIIITEKNFIELSIKNNIINFECNLNGNFYFQKLLEIENEILICVQFGLNLKSLKKNNNKYSYLNNTTILTNIDDYRYNFFIQFTECIIDIPKIKNFVTISHDGLQKINFWNYELKLKNSIKLIGYYYDINCIFLIEENYLGFSGKKCINLLNINNLCIIKNINLDYDLLGQIKLKDNTYLFRLGIKGVPINYTQYIYDKENIDFVSLSKRNIEGEIKENYYNNKLFYFDEDNNINILY